MIPHVRQKNPTLPPPFLKFLRFSCEKSALPGGKVHQLQGERPFTVVPKLDHLPPFSEAGSKDQFTSPRVDSAAA